MGTLKKGDVCWMVYVMLHGDYHEGLLGIKYAEFAYSKETVNKFFTSKGYDVKKIEMSIY